ncbi:putative carboxylesterase 18 [Hibiscus syriacus]|uniref:Carboxylesterase 18 n=1 Tax=Hibiscus syriacus TaxID=106335 RepID=A0A6A2ZUI9_HIBSY|nr:probable carboxylesterase 18 [Hibiscus syriacus]KAE8694939.1 putative carboxylesterase 18 [Hibiscus syriacus]
MPSMAPQRSKLTLPLKTRIFISLLSTATDAACRSDGSINRRLLRLLDYQVAPNPKPTNSVSSSDTTVDASRNLWFRLLSPSLPSDVLLPVVIFFHGGGFTFLSPASLAYDAVCRRFARKFPAFVVSVNYRLAPEHIYPSQYEDGLDVLKFLDDNRDAILTGNANLSRCFLAGDSAGGNIAHNVAVRACKEEFGTLKLRGVVCIQPFFGGEERTEAELELVGAPLVSVPRTDFCWKALLPKGSTNRDHPAVNVSGPNAENIAELDFPATMVVVAGFDPLKDWQRRYYEWVKHQGKKRH